MKKFMSLLLISIFFLSITVTSYAENRGISPAKRQDIEKFLDITMTDAYIKALTGVMVQAMSQGASVSRTANEEEKIAIIMESVSEVIIREFPILLEQFIPLYDETFTHEEIKQLNEFYETPVGKKTIQVMPELTQKGGALGMKWGESLTPKIKRDLRKKGISL